MNILIVGGGKVGFYLAKHLVRLEHRVTLIEKDPERSQKISDELNVLVIRGDGSDLSVLTDAGVQEADVVTVVTGRDEDNLVVSQVVKEHFNVGRIIARVNNPANEPIFHAVGIELTVSSTGVISSLLEEETSVAALRTLVTFHKGELALLQGIVGENSAVEGLTIQEAVAKLSTHSVFVAIIRGDQVIMPKGDTRILEGDKIVAISSNETRDELERLIIG